MRVLAPDEPVRRGADPERLRRKLERLPTEEVLAFAAEFDRRRSELNRWPVWGAGYVMAGGMSDDGFLYFRSWVVGLGRGAFETALRDPDALGAYADEPEELESEEVAYVATMVLGSRGEDPDLVPYRSEDRPEGEPFDEETVGAAYPRLTAKFG